MVARRNVNAEDGGEKADEKVCGIIMPISAMGEYDADHWVRVKTVLDEAIRDAKMVPRIVSESDEVTVIQSSIVQNLYDNEVVVCDVSGKNPNVMFELGLRLAFDKPTVIVQDDASKYNFDTGSVMHIGYRRDLRYDDVRDFKTKVTAAINASRKAATENENYSPFLKHYGKFTVAKLETNVITETELVSKQYTVIMNELARLNNRMNIFTPANPNAVTPAQNRLIAKYELDGKVTTKDILVSVADSLVSALQLVRVDDHSMNEMKRHLDRIAPTTPFTEEQIKDALATAIVDSTDPLLK